MAAGVGWGNSTPGGRFLPLPVPEDAEQREPLKQEGVGQQTAGQTAVLTCQTEIQNKKINKKKD